MNPDTTLPPDQPIPYELTPKGKLAVQAFEAALHGTGRHHHRVPGLLRWTPELHMVPLNHGVFVLTCADGRVREFINLALSHVQGLVVVFYDPSCQDECQTFALDHRKAPYLGAALLLSETGERHVHRVMLTPSDLIEDEWQPAHTAPECLTCYLLDANRRLALGYRDGHHFTILTGPQNLEPIAWHRSHTKEMLADAASQALTKGGQF